MNSQFHQVGIGKPQLNIKNPSLIKGTPSSSTVCTDPCRWNLKFHSSAPLTILLIPVVQGFHNNTLDKDFITIFISTEFIIGAINVSPALLFKICCFCWMKYWQGLLVHPMLSTFLFLLQVCLLCWDFKRTTKLNQNNYAIMCMPRFPGTTYQKFYSVKVYCPNILFTFNLP